MAEEKARSDRPLTRLFDFDPGRLADVFWPFGESGRIRIEQQETDDALLVRAELPGIDPDKDVEITISGDQLHLRAERRSEHKEEREGRMQSEFRYGAFSRTVRLPVGVNPDDVTAAYRDGILEIRVPMPVEARTQARRIPVNNT